MPRPHRTRPRQFHHHKTHGPQPDPKNSGKRLLTPSAQSRRLGRRFPGKPYYRMIFSPDCPELIAGLKVELGLDRVDLVGGNGRDDVNEGVDDGSMLGKVEG